jgi:hypothetical protein
LSSIFFTIGHHSSSQFFTSNHFTRQFFNETTTLPVFLDISISHKQPTVQQSPTNHGSIKYLVSMNDFYQAAQHSTAQKMCMWRTVFWIVCRHRRKQVVKCFEDDEFDAPCDDWDDQSNEQQTLTHDGRPYTLALNEMCPGCRWEAVLDAMEERGREREERERRDSGTNGINGINGINGTHGTHGLGSGTSGGE